MQHHNFMSKLKFVVVPLVVFGVLFFAKNCYAAIPTIFNVSGTIQTGQTLTITGTTMMDENKTNWQPMFQSGTAYGFEGTSYTNDNYGRSPDEMTYGTQGYATDVKLSGSQSAWSHCTVPEKTGAGFYFELDNGRTEMYFRGYFRWVSNGTWKWSDSYSKNMYTNGTFYVQPAASGASALPTQMLLGYDSGYGGPHLFDVDNFLINGRWYCIEARYKGTSPQNLTFWVDGKEYGNVSPAEALGTMNYPSFGPINMCCQGAGFDWWEWVDNYTASTSRIYPSTIIEIGNNSDYATATKVKQPLTFISDASTLITADLTGLGAGPYYLWVTNNRQERSAAYVLGNQLDTTPPAAPNGVTII